MTDAGTPSGASATNLRVRELRLARGWTQTELAFRAGTHAGEISRIESGRNVTTDVLYRLADALGVEVSELFPKPEVPKPPHPRTPKEKVVKIMASESGAEALGGGPQPSDLGPAATGWAGPGKRGLERLEALQRTALSLGEGAGPNWINAQLALTAAIWSRLFELRDAGEATEEKVLTDEEVLARLRALDSESSSSASREAGANPAA